MSTATLEEALPETTIFLEFVGSGLNVNSGRADVCPTAVTARSKRIVTRRTGAHSRCDLLSDETTSGAGLLKSRGAVGGAGRAEKCK